MNASESDMIQSIRCHIAKVGKMTNKAQSDWGMDRWEYNGITVGLGDAGYTNFVSWGDRLQCHHTIGSDVVYGKGDINELEILFNGIIGELNNA